MIKGIRQSFGKILKAPQTTDTKSKKTMLLLKQQQSNLSSNLLASVKQQLMFQQHEDDDGGNRNRDHRNFQQEAYFDDGGRDDNIDHSSKVKRVDDATRKRENQSKLVDAKSGRKDQVNSVARDKLKEEKRSYQDDSSDEIEKNENIERSKEFVASVKGINQTFQIIDSLKIEKIKNSSEKQLFMTFYEMFMTIVCEVFNPQFCNQIRKELQVFEDPLANSLEDGLPDVAKLFDIDNDVNELIDWLNELRDKVTIKNQFITCANIDTLTSFQRLMLISILARSVHQQFERSLMTTIGFTYNIDRICKKLQTDISKSSKDFIPKSYFDKLYKLTIDFTQLELRNLVIHQQHQSLGANPLPDVKGTHH
eukprot:403343931